MHMQYIYIHHELVQLSGNHSLLVSSRFKIFKLHTQQSFCWCNLNECSSARTLDAHQRTGYEHARLTDSLVQLLMLFFTRPSEVRLQRAVPVEHKVFV